MLRRMLAVSALALTLGTSAALAQGGGAAPPGPGGPGGGPGQMVARRMQMLLNGITLTPAQQATVDSIVAAFTARMPAFTPGQMPDSASRAQRRTVMMQQDSAVRALLTTEQQGVWDRNLAAMPQGRGPRP